MSQRCKDCVHYCIHKGEPACLYIQREGGYYFAPLPLRKEMITRFNKCEEYERRISHDNKNNK